MNTKVEEALATVSEYIGVAKPASSELTNDARLAVKDLAAHIAQQDATIARMREALESIRQYGSDTLSGRDPNDGPNDRDWQREGVREMRNRARAALNQGEG